MAEGRIAVLLIDSDPASVAIVREALAAVESEFRLEVAGQLAAGLERIAAGGIDIVLVHVPLPDANGFEGLERTLRQAGATPILVLSAQDDAAAALNAVRAGAQDYLVTGRLTGSSLVRCIWHAVERNRRTKELFAGSAPTRSRGKIVTFLGVKGGVGATTTVLNLAAALTAAGKQTIAVELGPLSNFAIHLKRSRVFDIGGLMELDPDRIDGVAVEEKLVTLPFGFRALFAPPRTGEPRLMQPEQARALIEGARELAEIVLVDLPAQISAVHRAVVAASGFVAVLMEPDPLSVEFAKETFQLLDRWGVEETARGLVVVNRAPLSNSIRPQEVRSRAGCELVGVVPSAGEACVMAFGANKLLFTVQPEARFSLAIKEIAESLLQNPVATLTL
jgi:Flp pilus assembly CpaE family ATPase